MKEAQEKNHTDHVDPSPRMPRGQLMRRAVTYMHQAGAGGTNAPHPSRKKFSLFLGTPSYRCVNLLYYKQHSLLHVLAISFLAFFREVLFEDKLHRTLKQFTYIKH